MPEFNTAQAIKSIRLLLAGTLVTLTQIEESRIGSEGSVPESEIPEMLFSCRDKVANAGALLADWDLNHNEGAATDLEVFQDDDGEITEFG